MSTPNTVDRQAQFIRLILAILGALLAIAGWARFAGAQPAAKPAVPLDPVTAIVDAFRTGSVVAVTAGHGDARGYAFGRMLATDPRIATVESLRRVWRETTQPGLAFQRKNIAANYESEGQAETIVSRLESKRPNG